MADPNKVTERATVYDFEIDRGASLDFTAAVKDVNGDPMNIGADKVRWRVVDGDGTEVYADTNSPGDHLSDAGGTSQFRLTSAITLAADATYGKITTWSHCAHWQNDSSPTDDKMVAVGKIEIRGCPSDAMP